MPAATRSSAIRTETNDSSAALNSAPNTSALPTKDTTSKSTSSPRRSKSTSISPPSTPLPTPSLTSASIKYNYAIARGEMGVLTYEPYKSLILPFWAFRTVPIAQSSADALMSIFHNYVSRGDFVGADMTRKYIQMGMTRAKRYANHKGGRKYDRETGEVLVKWTGEGVDGEEGRKRREKEEASELFKGYWRACIEDEAYKKLKMDWTREKKEWEKRKKNRNVGQDTKEEIKTEVKKEDSMSDVDD